MWFQMICLEMMPDGWMDGWMDVDGWVGGLVGGWIQEPLVYYQLAHKLKAQVY